MSEAYIYADYLTVNISSPNTKNLRDLHNISDLRIFIKSLMIEKNKLQKKWNKSVPIFLKLSPDIEEVKIKPIIDLLIANNIDGVIVTNTTIDKSKISKPYQYLPGGVSGAPLKIKSEQMLSTVKKISKNKLLIISVGGIMTADDALKRIRMGADLVQIYTGLIYQGPSLVNEIRQKLS
jgi:dihydroorotate dehydrogenase